MLNRRLLRSSHAVTRTVSDLVPALSVLLLLSTASNAAAQPSLRFVDVTDAAGLRYTHGYVDGLLNDPRRSVAGVAAGDYDGDGDVDIFMARGDIGPDLLLRNRGDGSFDEVGAAAGVVRPGSTSSGPFFVDLNGNDRLDLVVGGIEGSQPAVFLNQGNGTFTDHTVASGIAVNGNTFFGTFGDPDRDGDLDLFFAHWNTSNATEVGHIWLNRGDATFDLRTDAEVGIVGYEIFDYTLNPNFVDLDGDGWQDLAISGDFGTSKMFLNRSQGGALRFEPADQNVFTDENGMGASLADYDQDGDIDWFVSSIWDPDGFPNGNWGVTGNRLYQNRGIDADGRIEMVDVTTEAGVRIGYWGWGSCFVDFDHDGDLDLFHTNGFPTDQAGEFNEDPSRFFLHDGAGRFEEVSVAIGIDDTDQGRGVVCADFDGDGDRDILLSNNSQSLRLFRNDGENLGHALEIELRQPGRPNVRAIGSEVRVETGERVQTLRLEGLSNYMSQQPERLHVGLGDAERVDRLTVIWPDGNIDTYTDVAADQDLRLTPRGILAVPTVSPVGLLALALLLALAAARMLRTVGAQRP